MGQNLVMVCKHCKIYRNLRCRFTNIDKSRVEGFFLKHKGHTIKAVGSDGGWEAFLRDLEDSGYERQKDGGDDE